MTNQGENAQGANTGRRRGRPVQIDPARREEMVLEAAEALVAERVLSEVTMTAIAERAGMSKRTIYAMFDSREALLAACVGRLGNSLFRPLSASDRDRPLSERLNLLLTVHASPDKLDSSLELLRALLTEAHTFPALARRGCEESRDVLENSVAAELLKAQQEGELRLPKERISLAASILVDMAFENPIPILLEPEGSYSTAEQIAARREWAVQIFLRGVAVGDHLSEQGAA
ncbi:TetR/AcrR family transcriptional regulator [Tropicimonas isoalkanivorans]|uniref:Transcriptional regulator, TetR family n=1 Tax=Tropicimonas isoalkanivorans TaxID=441112 RepID=A0A1I1KBP9_9RHOB|nr:TetR/AcrR family transcriptional regulator [Tropicimonas isoalkanivorans]SFC58176.1 transcriptional regulator, TetR family [Tropicimonas isoalkanivorans]